MFKQETMKPEPPNNLGFVGPGFRERMQSASRLRSFRIPLLPFFEASSFLLKLRFGIQAFPLKAPGTRVVIDSLR
jgi:hypothetical protein